MKTTLPGFGHRLALIVPTTLLFLTASARADIPIPGRFADPNVRIVFGGSGGGVGEPDSSATVANLSMILLAFDPKVDSLDVDLRFIGSPEQLAREAGTLANPLFGGRKSVAVDFAGINSLGQLGTVAAIAGVAEHGPPGHFRLSSFAASPLGLSQGYGSPLLNATGTMLHEPTADHPDFEFVIRNVSRIPGLNIHQDFYLSAFAGSPDDPAGLDSIAWSRVAGFRSSVITAVPEPLSLSLLGLGATGLWLASRCGRRRAG